MVGSGLLTPAQPNRFRNGSPAHLQVIGELLQPGQRLLVAKGGKGGAGVRAPSRERKQQDLAREMKYAKVGHWFWRDGSSQDPFLEQSSNVLLNCLRAKLHPPSNKPNPTQPNRSPAPRWWPS